MKRVIYTGEGVSMTSFASLVEQLPAGIQAVDHRFFLSPNWEKRCELLIFPGGRDLPYHQALQGEANRRIAAFVAAGGHYLGICAGAYYAAAQIEFEKGGELEICEQRELGFFPGKAIGPAYGLGSFDYRCEAGARQAQIAWEKGVTPVYFNGGCYFERAGQHRSVEVLARYDDLPRKPAAIVHCRVGSGVAVLSGVHLEYSIKERAEQREELFLSLFNFG